MRLYRTGNGWLAEDGGVRRILDGFDFDQWLAADDPIASLRQRFTAGTPRQGEPLAPLLPIASQEVWAAGVTYLRSKAARMEESEFSANAYDKVYAAPRPELFFKATATRCVGPGGVLRLRSDSQWMVPEPELALVISANRKVVGFTIGDDLSCRDIEGENLLYLPQAKVWDGCCALGPSIFINDGPDIRRSSIRMSIRRNGILEFAAATEFGRMKRSFDELIDFLFRHQSFPHGVILLTGTGIVPPEGFSLKPGDEILMHVEEIGELINTVR